MPTSYWHTSGVCQMKVAEELLALGFPLSSKREQALRLPFSNGVYSTEYVPSALSWMRQSVGEPDGLVICVLMWSPPAFVRGRASTVNSVVASRKTSAGNVLKSHFKKCVYSQQQNIWWNSMINNLFGNTRLPPVQGSPWKYARLL